jgi:hypothetical protein
MPFKWPESLGSANLPWEAAGAALEMLQHCDEARLPLPTNRQAVWFWRLKLAAPRRKPEDTHRDAVYLAICEYLRDNSGGFFPGSTEGLQWDLAYNGQDKKRQESANRACDPRPVGRDLKIKGAGMKEKFHLYFKATFGKKFAENIQSFQPGYDPRTSQGYLEGKAWLLVDVEESRHE